MFGDPETAVDAYGIDESTGIIYHLTSGTRGRWTSSEPRDWKWKLGKHQKQLLGLKAMHDEASELSQS